MVDSYQLAYAFIALFKFVAACLEITWFIVICYRKRTQRRGRFPAIERLRCLHLSSRRSCLELVTRGKCLLPNTIMVTRWTAARFVLLLMLDQHQTQQASQIYTAVTALRILRRLQDGAWSRNPKNVPGRQQGSTRRQSHKASISQQVPAAIVLLEARLPWPPLTTFPASRQHMTLQGNSFRQSKTVVE